MYPSYPLLVDLLMGVMTNIQTRLYVAKVEPNSLLDPESYWNMWIWESGEKTIKTEMPGSHNTFNMSQRGQSSLCYENSFW